MAFLLRTRLVELAARSPSRRIEPTQATVSGLSLDLTGGRSSS